MEIRKSRPDTTESFLVDLYETKADGGCGEVIGNCLCFCTQKLSTPSEKAAVEGNSCVSADEIRRYSGERPISAWYLARVQKYKYPRKLSEYGIDRAPQSWCYVKRGDANADT